MLFLVFIYAKLLPHGFTGKVEIMDSDGKITAIRTNSRLIPGIDCG